MMQTKQWWSAGRWLAVLVLVGAAAVAVRLWTRSPEPAGGPNADLSSSGRDQTNATPPWGQLVRQRITIERPKAFVSLSRGFALQKAWFFGGIQPDKLDAFLRGLPFPTTTQATLLNQSAWTVESQGVWVPAPADLILGMTREARQALYPLLAQFPENPAQFAAFRFRQDVLDEWFEESGLTPKTLALVKERLYRRGNAVCFSDLGEVITQIPSPAEQLALVKALSRESTLLVKLRVDKHTDVDALVRYWGRRGRTKDLEPLLESLKRIPGGTTIDIAHLLPAFARQRLYTYTLPLEDQAERKQDCYWTAFNFFRQTPEDRYGDAASVKAAFAADYYIVQDEPTFGDIILLLNDRGMTIHAAVYIAENIVFTKNGAGFAHPWILMESLDLQATYTGEKPPQMIVYRLKDSD